MAEMSFVQRIDEILSKVQVLHCFHLDPLSPCEGRAYLRSYLCRLIQANF
jgi:hypothetical protein